MLVMCLCFVGGCVGAACCMHVVVLLVLLMRCVGAGVGVCSLNIGSMGLIVFSLMIGQTQAS
jgi:hypothetical protein